jgi:hypothetical protein
MSNEVREMLATLLDNIYGNWLETISSTLGNSSKSVYYVLREKMSLRSLLYREEKRRN